MCTSVIEQIEVLSSGKYTNGTSGSMKDGKLLENQMTFGFSRRTLPRVEEGSKFIR